MNHVSHLSTCPYAVHGLQGSFTSWRSNCDAFASLSGLSRLTCLTLHAFHCPGPQLTAALAVMTDMVQLRLSGRIVLEPLSTLHRLTRLQLLELTQDVQVRCRACNCCCSSRLDKGLLITED